MSVLYIASDGRGAGKTALTSALSVILSKKIGAVGVLKPLATLGVASDVDPDASIFEGLLGEITNGWPVQIPEGGLDPETIDGVIRFLAKVSEDRNAVIIEGSNALTPEDTAKLTAALDARVLVVSAYRRQLKASDLAAWWGPLGDSLIGCVVNGVTRYLETEARQQLLPTFETEGIECLGLIPEERVLLGVSLSQLAEHLNGRFVSNGTGYGNLLVRFQVGAMSLDPADQWFGQYGDNAVIVRGDRPDIQLSALRANISALVLTDGVEPIEYVMYEAEQEGVPVMVVKTDTIATMDAMSSLMERALFDHPRKLDRFVKLVEEHVDLECVLGALAIEH